MNQDIFEGQWKQMRGELKSWWSNLTDSDLDRIGGQKDKLIGLVQEKYGYTRYQAEQDVEQRFKEFADKTRGFGAKVINKAQEFGATAANKASEAAAATKDKATEFAHTVSDTVNPGEFMALCRRYPTEALISAAVIGFLLGRVIRR